MRRFRRHLLPRGFTKIRHYGLLANHARSRLVPLARATLGAGARSPKKEPAKEPAWPPPCAGCGGSNVQCRGFALPNGRYIAVRISVMTATRQAREPP